jgi:hypothetical protein
MHNVRNADTAGLSQSLQAGSDIDPITKDILVLKDDVAKIYAHSIGNPRIGQLLAILLGQGQLNFNCASHRVLNGRELNKQSIPGRLYDVPTVASYAWIEDGMPVFLLASQHATFVAFHESAVASHVSRKDGGKSTCHLLQFLSDVLHAERCGYDPRIRLTSVGFESN